MFNFCSHNGFQNRSVDTNIGLESSDICIYLYYAPFYLWWVSTFSAEDPFIGCDNLTER